ncbi:MAG: TadE family type IV pilus minor pilin [Nocardioides sp.]
MSRRILVVMRPSSRRGPRPDPGPVDRGAVTAETVLALPILLAVTVGLIWLLAVGAGQIRTIDAARETARALARGDQPSDAMALGVRVAPVGARLRVSHSVTQVRVVATSRIEGPGGLFDFLPAVRVQASSVALVEDASPGGGRGPEPFRRP